jgi:hypothetical protein
MRWRKPCVFLRFRLFGWYVLFTTPRFLHSDFLLSCRRSIDSAHAKEAEYTSRMLLRQMRAPRTRLPSNRRDAFAPSVRTRLWIMLKGRCTAHCKPKAQRCSAAPTRWQRPRYEGCGRYSRYLRALPRTCCVSPGSQRGRALSLGAFPTSLRMNRFRTSQNDVSPESPKRAGGMRSCFHVRPHSPQLWKMLWITVDSPCKQAFVNAPLP